MFKQRQRPTQLKQADDEPSTKRKERKESNETNEDTPRIKRLRLKSTDGKNALQPIILPSSDSTKTSSSYITRKSLASVTEQDTNTKPTKRATTPRKKLTTPRKKSTVSFKPPSDHVNIPLATVPTQLTSPTKPSTPKRSTPLPLAKTPLIQRTLHFSAATTTPQSKSLSPTAGVCSPQDRVFWLTSPTAENVRKASAAGNTAGATTAEDEVSDILKRLGRDGGSKAKGKNTKKPLAKSNSLTDLWMRSTEKVSVLSPSASDSGKGKGRSVALALALSQSPTTARRSAQQAATLGFSRRPDEEKESGGTKSLATRGRSGAAANRSALFELMGKVQSALASETARRHKGGAKRDKIEVAKDDVATVKMVSMTQRNKSAPALLQKPSIKEVVADEESDSDGEGITNNVRKKVARRKHVEIKYALDEAEAETEAAWVSDVFASGLLDDFDDQFKPNPQQNIVSTHRSQFIASQPPPPPPPPPPLQLPPPSISSKRKRTNLLPIAVKNPTPKKRRPLVLLDQNVPSPVPPPTLTPEKQSAPSSDDFLLNSDDLLFTNDVEAQEIEAMMAVYDAQPNVVFKAGSRRGNDSAVFLEGDETGPPSSPTRMPKQFLDGWGGIEGIEAAMALEDEEDEDEDAVKNGVVSQKGEMGTQARTVMVSPPSSPQRDPKYTRCIVLEVNLAYYMDENGSEKPEKILRLFEEAEGAEKYAHLREDWWHTNVAVGDTVHVLGRFDPASSSLFLSNSLPHLLILHPDVLISSTLASDSFVCLRKAVLEDRVRVTGETSEPMVRGHMLHQLLQHALREDMWTNEGLQEEVERIVSRNVEGLWCVGETEEQAREKVGAMVGTIQEWAGKFVGQRLKPTGIAIEHHAHPSSAATTVCIDRVVDIEEHVWSPAYGLKGMIDASVRAQLCDSRGATKTLTLPFEIKTGRTSSVMAHRAQTILYTLLMSDRYDIPIRTGLLYYMQSGETILVPSVSDEVRGLVIGRNEMACYLSNRLRPLPPMLRDSHACQRCQMADTCFVYHAAVEGGTAETSGLGVLFDRRTKHFTPQHRRFLERWDRLVALEEGDMLRFRGEIWAMKAGEREAKGRCLSEMRIDRTESKDVKGNGVMKYRYAFRKAEVLTREVGAPGLMASHITVGDPVVISTELGHYALAIGFVVEMDPERVVLTVDRRIKGAPRREGGFDEEIGQSFVGMRDLSGGEEWGIGGVGPWKEKGKGAGVDHADETLYRIDKDEMASGMGLVRNNLVQLFTAEGDERRRRLVVDLEAPRFVPIVTAGAEVEAAGMTDKTDLNSDQRRAIEKVLSAKDYALILGMPGTGKTTTIACLIKTLVTQGKSVLLTSYTHSAVDNVLLKVREAGIDVMRLGNRDKVHPKIQDCTPNHDGRLTTVAALEVFYASKSVVGTTCLGIGHPIFTKRRFDYCIVDEASQITLPVCIGPLRYANVFVLVGDHYQLPPLVRNPDAKQDGLSVSLFKLLSEAHPEAVVMLEHQYRMCRDVMALSNALVYDHRLRCGTPAIAERCLVIPDLEGGIRTVHTEPAGGVGVGEAVVRVCEEDCWVRELVNPRRKVVFVDTDDVPALDSRSGDLVQNEIEATLVHQLVESLLACGVDPNNLGVISVYRSQLKLISHRLRGHPAIEIHTVDRYQGRDKECVVVSLVRSNRKKNVGDLLRDWRRINVAFTRAKTKLVIFGSRSTLEGTQLFREFIALVEENGWIYKLPKNAHLMHVVPSSNPAGTSQETVENAGSRGRATVMAGAEAVLKGRGILRNVVDGI